MASKSPGSGARLPCLCHIGTTSRASTQSPWANQVGDLGKRFTLQIALEKNVIYNIRSCAHVRSIFGKALSDSKPSLSAIQAGFSVAEWRARLRAGSLIPSNIVHCVIA